MKRRAFGWLGLVVALVLSSCHSSITAPCDCTEYPFKPACDSQCGMRDAVVQSVQGNSITIKTTPTTPGQKPELRTIPIDKLASASVEDLKPGTHIQMTFSKLPNGGTTVKSLKPVAKPAQFR